MLFRSSDIAGIHPTTSVTLLHSRTQLLPVFDEGLHSEVSAYDVCSVNVAPHASPVVVSQFSAPNICTILGDRLDLSSLANKMECGGQRAVRTQSGREIRADLIVRPA